MTNLARLPPRQKQPNLRGTLIDKRYNAWMHLNCVCCLTGYTVFENAHTGGVAEGKGMGRKAPVWTILPLRKELHMIEESARDKFWAAVGFPDHLDWAKKFFEYFEAGFEPDPLLLAMNRIADKPVLISMLRGEWKG